MISLLNSNEDGQSTDADVIIRDANRFFRHHCRLEKSKQAEVRREEGLSTAIEPENKGFQMLAKMGYKPGSTLGRAPDAVSEPIKIVVKADRGGLGKTEAEKEKRRKLLEATREQLARREELARDYRSHKSSAMAEKLVAKDLYTSQKACLTQDQEAGIDEPLVSWYWPPGSCTDHRSEFLFSHCRVFANTNS
jgi:hypothetical protein